MKKLLLATALSAAAAPVCAAGLPPPNALSGVASALTPHSAAAPSAGSLPLPPAVLDLGLSTPGFGSAAHNAPPATTLPGLADIMPYYDNTGTGGRMNADLEVDTYGQAGAQPLLVYGLVFTDPPKHPLHLVGNLLGVPIDQRVDQP